jgi:hypothetical protein
MARLIFTGQLKRFVETPELDTDAPTLRLALEEAFRFIPRLRGYIVDEQGHLRPHMVIFIDGRRSKDRTALSDPVMPDSQVYVLQALSGG